MDKVGDSLIRIKNGYMAARKEVLIPYSSLRMTICGLLQKEGYLDTCKKTSEGITVALKYDNKKPALTDVKRISKPGRRIYSGAKSLPYVREGMGLAIISTPKGIMSDRQARKEGLGGEVMAFVW